MTVQITGANHRRDGVCRVNGFTVFVPFAIFEEKIEIELTVLKKNYGVGKIVSLVELSPARVEPRCPVFGQCGGCHIQQMNYEAQCVLKEGVVQEAMVRIGGLGDGEIIQSIIPADFPWYYRNKAQVPVGIQHGKTAIGFYQHGSHTIVETPECFIQQEKNNEVLEKMKELIRTFNIRPYNEQTGTGDLRHVIVRHSKFSKETMLILVTREESFHQKKEFMVAIQKEIPEIQSFHHNVNSKKGNRILGDKMMLISGKETIEDSIGPFLFDLSPQSFFQVNPEQTRKIYELVMEYAAPCEDEVIVDAYCGIGTISLYLSQKAKKVYGIEIVPEAVADAQKNAERNGISNAEFILGAVEEVLPELEKRGIHIDTLVVDPPRKGCEESLIQAITSMGIQRVIYVSCNPASLARDIKIFTGDGYRVESVQPVDQFPQTYHVETVVLMSRAKE